MDLELSSFEIYASCSFSLGFFRIGPEPAIDQRRCRMIDLLIRAGAARRATGLEPATSGVAGEVRRGTKRGRFGYLMRNAADPNLGAIQSNSQQFAAAD
jgi:hypothetical protein